MKWRGCSRLDELRHALWQGHWPQACTMELRAHVEGCSRCGDEILVTKYLQLDRSQTMEVARIGTGSLLWWRAQARRRNSALERAARPLVAAEIFALLVVVAATIWVAASQWHSFVSRVVSAKWSLIISLSTILGDWGLVPLLVG